MDGNNGTQPQGAAYDSTAKSRSLLDIADSIVEGAAKVATEFGAATANPIALAAGGVLNLVDSVLDTRQGTHGDFTDNANIADTIQQVMQASPNWTALSSVQRQALTNISGKISRILSGDPNYADNWIGIQGYAKLAQDRLPVAVTSVASSGTDTPVTPIADTQHPDVLANVASVANAAADVANAIGQSSAASAINEVAQVATTLRGIGALTGQ